VRVVAVRSGCALGWRAARDYLLAGGIKGRESQLDAPRSSKNRSLLHFPKTMPAFTGGLGTFSRPGVRDLAAETASWAWHAAAQAGSSRCGRPGAPFAKKADRTGCGLARSLVGSQIGSKQGIGGAPTDPRARAHQHPFLAATKESVVRLRHAAEKQSAAASLLLLFEGFND
jgi:hypothetical protein